MYQNIIPGHLSDWLTRSTCPQEQWEDSNGGALRAFGEDESSYVEVPLGGFEGEIEKTHCLWERWRGFYEFHSLCPGLLLATRSARKLSLVAYCYKDKLYN